MKLKAYFLLMAFTVAPALAMEERLTAEAIINHPKFLEAKQAIEEMGGSIKIWPNRIYLERKLESGTNGLAAFFDSPIFWKEVNDFYQTSLAWKTHPWELERTLPKTLRGLCILAVARRYYAGNQEVTGRLSELPEDVQLIISKLKGHV